MDNHKPVTIFIFVFFKKHDKNMILSFLKNIHEKLLGFGCMHENQTFFLYLKWKFIFEFSDFFLNSGEKLDIFISSPYFTV
jgi:hypothetical protein